MADTIEGLIQDAQSFASNRNWDKAIEAYSKVLDLGADSDEACKNLAQIYALRGMFKSTISTYLRLMKIYANRNDIDNAMNVADYVLLLAPDSVEVRAELINMYRARGEVHEVVARSVELARLYTELDEGDKSIELLQAVMNDEPGNIDVCCELAEMYVQYGQVERGVEQYRQAADLYQNAGEPAKSAECLERLLVISPNDAGATFQLGTIFCQMEKWEDAERQFRNALRSDFENLDIMFALGDVCQRKGDLDGAALAFRRISMMAPDYVLASERLGEIYHMQNNVELAIKNYLTAAGLYVRNGERDRAVNLYQRVIFLDPNNPTATRELTNMGAPVEKNDGGIKPIATKSKSGKGDSKKSAKGGKARSGLVPKSGGGRAGLVSKGSLKPGAGGKLGKPMLGEDGAEAPRPGLMRAGLKPGLGGKAALGSKPSLGGKPMLGGKPVLGGTRGGHHVETPVEPEPVEQQPVPENEENVPASGVELEKHDYDVPAADNAESGAEGENAYGFAPPAAPQAPEGYYPEGQPAEQQYAGQEGYYQEGQPAEQQYAGQEGYYQEGRPAEQQYAGQEGYYQEGQPAEQQYAGQEGYYQEGQPAEQQYAGQEGYYQEGQPAEQQPHEASDAEQQYSAPEQVSQPAEPEPVASAAGTENVSVPSPAELPPLIFQPEGELLVPVPSVFLERTDLYNAIREAVVEAPDPAVLPWVPLQNVDEDAIQREREEAAQKELAAESAAEDAHAEAGSEENGAAASAFSNVESFDFSASEGLSLKGISGSGLRRKSQSKAENASKSGRVSGGNSLSERVARMRAEAAASDDAEEENVAEQPRHISGINRHSASSEASGQRSQKRRGIMGTLSRPINQVIEEANQKNGVQEEPIAAAPPEPAVEEPVRTVSSSARGRLADRVRKARRAEREAAMSRSSEMNAAKAEAEQTQSAVTEQSGIPEAEIKFNAPEVPPHLDAPEAEQQFAGAPEAEQQFAGAPEAEQQFAGAPEAEQQFAGAPEAEEQFAGAPEVEEQFAGAPEAEQQFVGAPEAEQQFVGAPEAEEQFAGGPEAEQQFAGAPEAEEQFAGAPEAEEQFTGAPEAEQQFAGAPEAEEQFTGAPEAEEQFVGAPEAEEQFVGAPEAEEQFVGAPEAEEQFTGAPETEEQFVGASEAEEQFTGAPEAEEQFVGAPEAEEQFAGAPEAEEQITGAPEDEEQLADAPEASVAEAETGESDAKAQSAGKGRRKRHGRRHGRGSQPAAESDNSESVDNIGEAESEVTFGKVAVGAVAVGAVVTASAAVANNFSGSAADAPVVRVVQADPCEVPAIPEGAEEIAPAAVADISEPEAAESDVIEAAASENEASEPGQFEEGTSESDAAEAEIIEAGTAESEAVEAEIAEAGPAETEAVEAEVVETGASEAAEAGTVEAGASEPEAADSEAAENGAAELGDIEPETAAAGTGEAETGELEVSEPDAEEGHSESDTAESESEESESAGDGLCSLSVESELPSEYLEEAKRLREKLSGADVTTSIGEYRRAVENSPENLVLRTDLADIHLRFSLLDDAINQYRQIIRRKPDSVALRHRLACAYLWSEDFEDAANVYLELAELHISNGQFADAVDVLQTVLSLDPQNFKARRMLIDRFVDQGKTELAIHHLRQFVDASLSLNSVDNAISALKQLIDLSDEPSAFIERLAKVYEDHGNTVESLVYYRQLYTIYTEGAQWEEALGVCEKLVALEPQNFEERRHLISLYEHLERHDKVLAEQYELAGLYQTDGSIEEAAELYESVINRDPSHYEARRHLVDCRLEQGNLPAAMEQVGPLTERYESERLASKAIAMYVKLVEADPDSIELREKLLNFYTMADQRDDMLHELLTLADIREKNGDYRESVRSLRQAIELVPERADLHCRLAKLYDEQLHSMSGAMQEYRKVCELEPSDSATMRRYAQLLLDQQQPKTKQAAGVLRKLESVNAQAGKTIISEICKEFTDRIDADGDDLNTRFIYGELCYYLEEYKASVAQFQKTRKDPELELRSYNMLGLAFERMTLMRKQAAAQFRAGLNTKGHNEQDYLELRYNLATLLYREKNLSEALNEFKNIVAVDVTYRDAEAMVKELQTKIAAGGGGPRVVPSRRKQ